MSKEYTDRFSEASKKQPGQSAFVCESCQKEYTREEAEKQLNTCCDRSLKELYQEGFGPSGNHPERTGGVVARKNGEVRIWRTRESRERRVEGGNLPPFSVPSIDRRKESP